ncbi:MAG: amidohydrolase family protein [Armatimonadaceae bacterium]
MEGDAPFTFVDAHLHYVDFLQKSDGMTCLLEQMDAANVSHAVLFGMPVMKEWSEWEHYEPFYYLGDNSRCYYYSMTDAIVGLHWQSLPEEQQKRIIPLLCGFSPVDRYAVQQVERTLDLFPDVFRGIGEILLRHDDLTNLLLSQPPRPNHPALRHVYRLAGKRNLPVLLHHDFSSVWRRDGVYLPELREAVEQFPETTFIWAHAGYSRRIDVPNHTDHVEEMLSRYTNLYVDLSWLIFDEVMYRENQVSRRWHDLCERFSDRLCLGSDLTGHFDELPEKMWRYAPFLQTLSDSTRENLAHRTAKRVYGISPKED